MQKIFRTIRSRTAKPRISDLLWLVAFTTLACVTVNVNFPESAVQKATDDYVKDLYRAKEKGKSPAAVASPAPKDAMRNRAWSLETVADAAEEDFTFKVDTSRTREIQARQAARLTELESKAPGQYGETSEGKLVMRASDDLKKKSLLLGRTEKLVSEENKDRAQLYEEILKENKLPAGRLKDIAKKFANSFRDAAPAGTWIQDDSGNWKKK